MRRLRLIAERDKPVWVWFPRLDRRNGYFAWGPVGTLFNRRKLKHWLIAAWVLWRDGKRP